MRLFVALGVPAAVRRRLDAAVAPVRSRHRELRWTRPANWHLTLAFLGTVDGARVPEVETAVAAAAAETAPPPLRLRLAPAGHFGRRVLWVGVADRPEGTVQRLATAVRAALGAAGLPCDDKPVHPHVTLARAPGRQRLPQGLVDAIPTVETAWTTRSAAVMASVTGADGVRYERVAAIDW